MSDPLRFAKLFLGVATVASVGVIVYQFRHVGRASASQSDGTVATVTAASDSAETAAPADPEAPETVTFAVTSPVSNAKILFRGETNTLPYRQDLPAGTAPEVLEVTAPQHEGRRFYVKVDRARHLVIALPNGSGMKDASYDETAVALGTAREQPVAAIAPTPQPPPRFGGGGRRGGPDRSAGRDPDPPSQPPPSTASPTITTTAAADPPVVDRIADPPPSAPAPTPGSVDLRGVRATVRAHAPEVQACYERARLEKSDLHGKLSVGATLGPSGQVLNVGISSSSTGSARLESCVTSAFRAWTFPAPAGGVNGTISYTFNFD